MGERGAEIPADDWPSFQRTPANDGYTPSTAPTAEPSERWSTMLSGSIDGQVTVVDGTVYVATDDGTVHALDAADGDERWTESLEGGRSQCPCVVDGLVVVGTDEGRLVALDAADGEREWTTELAGPVAGSTAADGIVYVGTSDVPTAYAIDPTDGDELWSAELAADAVDYPAVTDDSVYAGAEDACDGRLHALDPIDGTERWVHEGTRMQSPTEAGNHVLAPATTIEALPPDDDSHRQIGVTGQILSSPAATPESIVYGTDAGRVGTIDHDEFEAGWNVSVGRYSITGLAVTDDAVYATMIGPELLAFDLESGGRLWSQALESGVATGPTAADGAVFVGTDDGRLVAFD